jgi:hypothetical protein
MDLEVATWVKIYRKSVYWFTIPRTQSEFGIFLKHFVTEFVMFERQEPDSGLASV